MKYANPPYCLPLLESYLLGIKSRLSHALIRLVLGVSHIQIQIQIFRRAYSPVLSKVLGLWS